MFTMLAMITPQRAIPQKLPTEVRSCLVTQPYTLTPANVMAVIKNVEEIEAIWNEDLAQLQAEAAEVLTED